MEHVSYMDLECVRLFNGDAEVLVTTGAGPRVLRYALAGQDNILGEVPNTSVPTALGAWHPLGGHRLWVAPEIMPSSYAPDDAPAELSEEGDLQVTVTAPIDAAGMQKSLSVTLAPSGPEVTLRHRIVNRGHWPVEVAPWAITIMRGGGSALIPQAPFVPHGEALLPARPVALWPFTDLSDPRWTLGPRFLRLRADPAREHPQKIGAGNAEGWAAYAQGESLFVKRFAYVAGARYPDFGCNVETYVAGAYAELESLAPLSLLGPGEASEHLERWWLQGGLRLPQDDDALAQALAPVLSEFR